MHLGKGDTRHSGGSLLICSDYWGIIEPTSGAAGDNYFSGGMQNWAVNDNRDPITAFPKSALHRVCASRGTNEDKHSSNQPWGYFLGDSASVWTCSYFVGLHRVGLGRFGIHMPLLLQ
jgi:hypothetical protein